MNRMLPIVLAAATALGSTSIAALAQQKTAKECSAEWRANKTENQAKGVTERAYVTQCRMGGGGASNAAPSTTQAAPAPAGTGAAAAAQQKTARECSDEWQANKADFQAKRITERAYVTQCRKGAAGNATAAGSGERGASAAVSGTTTSASPPAASPVIASPATASPGGANQFTDETQAKAHCPADVIVWVNLNSRIYHFRGSHDYGDTKKGAFMCERDATAQGIRAAKSEKHPS